MKKTIIALVALLIPLGILLCSCQPAKNLPYRVWESWDEMKEVLGDHYLYPTYLPEYTRQSKQTSKQSEYNDVPRDSAADELYYRYLVYYTSGNTMDDFMGISATDHNRKNVAPPPNLGSPRERHDYEQFHEHTVTVDDVDIEFYSSYETLPLQEGFDPDEWFEHHARNARTVSYSFQINTVTYTMSWVQYNVEDKYADDEQREEMLKVAKSIIEQKGDN